MERDRYSHFVRNAWLDQKQWKEDERKKRFEEKRKAETEMLAEERRKEKEERRNDQERRHKLGEWKAQLDHQVALLRYFIFSLIIYETLYLY